MPVVVNPAAKAAGSMHKAPLGLNCLSPNGALLA